MSLIMILVKEGEQVQRNNLNATAFEKLTMIGSRTTGQIRMDENILEQSFVAIVQSHPYKGSKGMPSL
jgi:hypothetical protein